MKICVIGASGQLGYMLTTLGERLGEHDIVPLNRNMIEITDSGNVYNILTEIRPDVVINCAAYNEVDKAELEESLCRLVNATSCRYISEACQAVSAKMIHLSTDYVFNGEKRSPYYENDGPNPLQVYGLTKLEGEREALHSCSRAAIIRISWLYSNRRKNFLKAVVRNALQTSTIKVVDDQIGSPTDVEEASKAIFQLVKNCGEGVFHYSGSGACSRFEFAQAIVRGYNISCEVVPCATEDIAANAVRPQYSYLGHKRYREVVGREPEAWQETLGKFIRDNPLDVIIQEDKQ